MPTTEGLGKDSRQIEVPSSTANVGLGFDTWCLGLQDPSLSLIFMRRPQEEGITVVTTSRPTPPEGRSLGYAGVQALKFFLKDRGISEGAHLDYVDNMDYPVGGLGRSGAESVGAILAAASSYEISLTRDEVIYYSSKGEPGEHKDNVAGSTNGGFNIIAKSPGSGEIKVDVYKVPENLGVAIGYSSHQKTTGTEGMREVLKIPISPEDFVLQMQRVSAATAALIAGNTDRFLELVWGDLYHEPRRANICGYGRFLATEFIDFKRSLFEEYGIALNVSGAGPNMQFLYNTERHYRGFSDFIKNDIIRSWFNGKGVNLFVREATVAKEGAYDYTQRQYGF